MTIYVTSVDSLNTGLVLGIEKADTELVKKKIVLVIHIVYHPLQIPFANEKTTLML
jgi:hypothetical protein